MPGRLDITWMDIDGQPPDKFLPMQVRDTKCSMAGWQGLARPGFCHSLSGGHCGRAKTDEPDYRRQSIAR